MAAFAAAGLGFAIFATENLDDGLPQGPFAWVLFLLGTLLSGIAMAVGLRTAAGSLPDILGPIGRTSAALVSRTNLRALLVFLLVGISVSGLWFGGSRAWIAVQRAVEGCPTPFELRVLTSTDSVTTFRAAARAYEDWVANERGCREVSLSVYAADRSATREAFGSGWSARNAFHSGSQFTVGPHPDVWIPASSLGVEQIDEDAGNANFENRGSIARSPLVFGVPSSAADELGSGLRRQGETTGNLLDEVREAGLGVVRPEPAVDISGALHTAGLYPDDNGQPNDPSQPHSREYEIERFIAKSLDAGNYPLNATAGLLCHAWKHDQAAEDVVMLLSEHALIRYNEGSSGSKGCPLQDGPLDELFAFYPKDGYALNYPFIQVDWEDPDDVQGHPPGAERRTEEIRRFERWLHSAAGEDAIRSNGLRAADAPEEPPSTRKDWLRFGVSSHGDGHPSIRKIDHVMGVYKQLHRPGRILLALDTSGSMDRRAGGGEGTLLDAAIGGVAQAVRHLDSARDAFGLWVFPGTDDTFTEVIRVDEWSADDQEGGAEFVRSRLSDQEATGGTPLFSTMVAGIQQIRQDEEAQRADADNGLPPVRALVVLTDGENSVSGSPAKLERLADTSGVRVFVVGLGDGVCADTTLQQVTDSSGGECYQTDSAGLPDTIEDLFRQLRGGSSDGD